jgi:hypothetical protein
MLKGAVLFTASHATKMDSRDTLLEAIPSAPFSVVYFNTPWSLDKASALHILGDIAREQGSPRAVQGNYKESLAILQEPEYRDPEVR